MGSGCPGFRSAGGEPAGGPAKPGAAVKSAPQAGPVPKGQRVFTCGHSFHYFLPGILSDIAKKAGITDHQFVGLSAIGGSRVIQHWNVPEAKNKAKEALKAGKVDVLTLAPIICPTRGSKISQSWPWEHNPKVRITVQEFWLPYDVYDTVSPLKGRKVDHNEFTGEELRTS